MRRIPVLVLTFLLLAAAPAGAALIWDYGPSTGTPSGAWANGGGQTFAERVSFAVDQPVNGITIFTPYSTLDSDTFHVRIYADAVGEPGALLSDWTENYSLHVFEGNFGGSNIYRAEIPFGPYTFTAGTTYWVGAAGATFDNGQYSILSPGDGQMAQFSGGVYQSLVGLGDQMFELTYTVPTPEPGTCLLFGLGAVALAGLVRRRRRA